MYRLPNDARIFRMTDDTGEQGAEIYANGCIFN